MNFTDPGRSPRTEASTSATPHEDGDVVVVAAGMHDADLPTVVQRPLAGRERQVDLFGDRQRVHVGAQRHHRPGPPAPAGWRRRRCAPPPSAPPCPATADGRPPGRRCGTPDCSTRDARGCPAARSPPAARPRGRVPRPPAAARRRPGPGPAPALRRRPAARPPPAGATPRAPAAIARFGLDSQVPPFCRFPPFSTRLPRRGVPLAARRVRRRGPGRSAGEVIELRNEAAGRPERAGAPSDPTGAGDTTSPPTARGSVRRRVARPWPAGSWIEAVMRAGPRGFARGRPGASLTAHASETHRELWRPR